MVAEVKREEIEFWNGALKGVLGAEQELNEAADEATAIQLDGMKVAVATIRNYRRRLEKLHAQGIRELLGQFDE